MKKELSLLVALLVAAAPAPAQPAPRPAPPAPQQQPAPAPTPAHDAGDDEVVRITSNLVQFDAVVTDKRGRLVEDLGPEDFEVLLDGERQEITNFSLVSSEPRTAARAAAPRDPAAPSLPPALARPSDVRRTIALVVDDLGTSFESLIHVRRALGKFVDEQMQPGDLVAVLQTGRSTGALQQFTSDKQLLRRAIERVVWNPIGRSDVAAFPALEPDASGNLREEGVGRKDDAGEEDRTAQDLLADLRNDIFVGGTLGALEHTVRGMRELPGRKSVVLVSDGLQIYVRGDQIESRRIREKLRRLTDAANRASVVVYTLDARGLPPLQLTAADSLSPTLAGNSATRDQARLARVTAPRAYNYYESQEGLRRLAEDTGGLFIGNTNDLGGGLRRVLDDQKGYYLIGFRPAASVFEREQGAARYKEFKVRVKRPGLTVRSRAGFYGYHDAEVKTAAPSLSRVERMRAAIASPLTAGDLNLRLTSLFNSPRGRAPVVDSLLHIDMSRVRFADEAGGWKAAVVDIVALTFDEDGRVVDEVNRTETVRARAEALERLLAEGMVYSLKVPAAKPGAYQLRVAVRDAATEQMGSAGQFIIVPDLARRQLALSGIFVAPAAGAGANALREAAVRRFRQGAEVEFQYHIYNARVDPQTRRPRLRTQVRLLRDGRPVLSAPAAAFDPAGQTDTAHLVAASRLRVGRTLEPGDYVLQVVVTDELARGKARTATQWIDFELVR